MVLVFVGALFLGSMLVPGRHAAGPDIDGRSPTYKLNGLALFLPVIVAARLAQASGWFFLSALHTHFVALFVVGNLFAFVASGWLCWAGARVPGGSPGLLRSFFFGRALNPTWLGVDLKLFSYRPSLIGRWQFSASFALVQYETYGELTLTMALYQIFTFVYVLNYFHFEHGMLHTWDVISERFGWMLVWGDYVLVPFFYSLAAWWLIHESEPLFPIAATAIALLFAVGFWLFRGANQQKYSSSVTRESPSGDSPAGLWTGTCSSQDSGRSSDISTITARSASTLSSP